MLPLDFILTTRTRDNRMASSSLKLSIVYITKRPGSYDVLFNSILQQNYPLDYELICIDDALPLAKGRAEAVIDYANK